MGRVKRYKKIKACDPFASKTRKNDDDKYDQPPTRTADDDFDYTEFTFTEEAKKKDKKKKSLEKKWEAEVLRQSVFTSEKPSFNQLESKRPEENIKQFKKRIQQETNQLLMANSKASSSTQQKRKKYLNERKKKKKLKKKEKTLQGSFEEDDFIQPQDTPSFGDTNDAPPTFTMIPKLKAGKKKHGECAQQLPQQSLKSEKLVQSQKEEEYKRKQMEMLRTQAMQAYNDLKKRRRDGATKYAAGVL